MKQAAFNSVKYDDWNHNTPSEYLSLLIGMVRALPLFSLL